MTEAAGGAAGGGGGGLKFNKMMVMVPVMLAARKIPSEDPDVIFWLRVAYTVVQCVCVSIVAYTYIQASSTSKSEDRLIYVPPPAMVRLHISLQEGRTCAQSFCPTDRI